MKLKFFYVDGSTYVASKVTWWLDIPEENVVLYRTEKVVDDAVTVHKMVKIKRNELLAVVEKTNNGFAFTKISKNVTNPAVGFITKESDGRYINVTELRF